MAETETETTDDDTVAVLRSGSALVRRRRVVLLVAGGAALLSIGGVVGAWYVKSPAQLAADTAPPKASIITAPGRTKTGRPETSTSG